MVEYRPPKVRVKSKLLGVLFMAKYSEAFKLQVVQEYLDGPLGYSALAKKHTIPDAATVRKWGDIFPRIRVGRPEEEAEEDGLPCSTQGGCITLYERNRRFLFRNGHCLRHEQSFPYRQLESGLPRERDERPETKTKGATSLVQKTEKIAGKTSKVHFSFPRRVGA